MQLFPESQELLFFLFSGHILWLAGLAMDERGAWRIDLDSGQQIRLGTDAVGERLDRFFSFVLPALAGWGICRAVYLAWKLTPRSAAAGGGFEVVPPR